jgi:glucose dehydrogenase
MSQPSFWIRLLMCTAASYAAELESSDPGWPFWGGNLNNTRSTSLSTLVNQTSVANLTVAFSVALLGPVSASPFVHGSSVVVPTWAGQLYSLDSLTGTVEWQRTVNDYVASSLCDRPTEYNFTEGPTGVIARTTPALAAPDLIVIGTQVADPLVAGLPYIMGEHSSKVPRKSSRAGLFTVPMLSLYDVRRLTLTTK